MHFHRVYNWVAIQAVVLVLMLPLSSLVAVGQVEESFSWDSYCVPAKWRCIGPFRGGRSVCASGVPGQPQTYFMGTTGGGLWKTENAGQHWHNVSDGFFKTGSVGAIAVSSSDPNVVYVGMGEHAPRGVMTSHGDGMYKSTDSGKTWKHLGLEETEHIARIVIHPKNPDYLYVAAQGSLHSPSQARGIYRSSDGGENWERIYFVNELTGCSELCMDPTNPQVLYATMWEHQRKPWIVISGGPGSQVIKSTDGGDSWQAIHEGLPEEKGKAAIAVAATDPERVYLLLEGNSDEEKGGLFVSKDGGEKWNRVSEDHRLIQRAWYYTEVFVDPNDEHTVYVLSASALRSIDGGKSWETLSGTHGDFHDLWINPKDSHNMVIANDGGAAISFDQGRSWSRQDNMPTAQLYRVNVDNHFPYRIYGGQQDNSSIRIANMQLASSGITAQSWSPSAGGESAFLAFDPDNPRFVMGGSYLGTVELLDTEAAAGTKVMAAPIQYLGKAAREMRYLFNWNAPIIWSQQEPNTYYHAAQLLLKTTDGGISWEEASPDLTRNLDNKQGKGGGPLTVEAVGAENYGTISYVAESALEPGVLWTGSDDGMVYLTKDGGKSWVDVTPADLEECLVNSIELSPHDAATAYIATTRYKFGDKRPGLYKTTDYGESWTAINDGIPEGAFTRVVREDTHRKSLLFAGTETGMYISWNGGLSWEGYQSNLPVTPILDLIIRHDDVIAATSGRSAWVFDDLGLLRQIEARPESVHLYKPEPAVLSNHGSQLNGNDDDFDGTHPMLGVNPANGIVFYYHLPKLEDDETIELEILDSAGNLVNQFSSKTNEAFVRYAGGPPAPSKLPQSEGLNRFVWDMSHQTMPGIPTAYIEASYGGHKAIPGRYTARLHRIPKLENEAAEQNDFFVETELVIKPNPLYSLTEQDYRTFDKFMEETEQILTEMHHTVNQLHQVQKQLDTILGSISENAMSESLKEQTKAVRDELEAFDQEMVQRKSKAYDDVENFPNKFTAEYLFMMNQATSGLPKLIQPVVARRAELDARWLELKQQADKLRNRDIPKLNQALWKEKIGAIWAIQKGEPSLK